MFLSFTDEFKFGLINRIEEDGAIYLQHTTRNENKYAQTKLIITTSFTNAQ